MKVKEKSTGDIYKVYGTFRYELATIIETTHQFWRTDFLIHWHDVWLWVDAKDYEPLEN